MEQQRLDYTYDDNGNVLTYRDNTIGGNNWLTTYTTDYANRLKTEIRTGGASFNFNNAYVYDKNGNRTTVTRNGTPSTYTVDDNDKLSSGDGFTLSGYSNDGNPGTINVPGTGNVTFIYDYENRAKQMTLPTRTNTFKYNADGQRVEQVSSQGTRRYVYDGWTIIAETDGSGVILTYFLSGVGYVAAATQYYYRDNALGSNLAVTNSTGIVQSLTEYDGYGIEYTVQAGANSQFRFAGKHGYQTDLDTGLDLLGHRYYAAKLGRFLTQDPIRHEAGLNLYAYCDNNPIVKIDAGGLQATSAMLFIGRAVKWFVDPHAHGWPTMDLAAKFVTLRYYGYTFLQQIEFGGYMLRDAQGAYWTPREFAFTGAINTVPSMAWRPDNAVAEWHTHPQLGIPYIDSKTGQRSWTGDPESFRGQTCSVSGNQAFRRTLVRP